MGLSLDGAALTWADGSPGQSALVKQRVRDLDLELLTIHSLGAPWPTLAFSPAAVCKHGFQNTGIPIIFSHASWMSEEDIRSVREHNLYTSITPESECHYDHGQKTGRFTMDRASLGIDTPWTFSGDLINQARLWLQLVRYVKSHETIEKGKLPNKNPMAVEEAFLLATRSGGQALRRNDIGVLQVGAKADLVVFDGESPNMLGWSNPIAAIILHANVSDVQHVLVDGLFRKRDFKLVDTVLTSAELRRRFVEAAKRIQHELAEEPPLPDKLFGFGEFGYVDDVSTKAK